MTYGNQILLVLKERCLSGLKSPQIRHSLMSVFAAEVDTSFYCNDIRKERTLKASGSSPQSRALVLVSRAKYLRVLLRRGRHIPFASHQ